MSGPVKDPLRALQGARSRAHGGRLEEQIEASCALLTETGRADISKTPEPMKPVSQPNKSGQFRAVYTKKAEPDFKGVMLGGRAVMFEAKSTGTGRLNKDRVLPEQVKKLDSYTALGAHCFIVATFDGLRVYRIPWTVWRSMKQRYGRNYVTEADIKEYAVRFGPGFTPDLLRGIPTMYDINPLSNVSDVLTAFCGMPYGTQHFSLMPNDQTNIDSMFAAITLGASEYPYHPDGGKCVMYSAADIITLYSEYKSFVTKQTTYCNALRQWAKRETDPNVIGSIYYGCALPEDLEKEVGDILSAAQAQITAIINKLSA